MKGAVCQHSCCSSQRLCHFLWHCPTFNGCSAPLQDPLFGFVLIANLQQALWQPGTPTTPWVFPSLGVVFLRGYLDTDQNLARFQPGQKQSHKSSHQGKIIKFERGSLTSLLSAHFYLHYSSTQRLGRDQGPLALHALHIQRPCSFLKGLLLTTHTLHHGEK